jgi:alanine racemase
VRNCRISIDPQALQHNLNRVKQLISNECRVMAVIKANAYGHGMNAVADALTGADAFAVATLGEAMQLREQGCDKAITVFHGFSRVDEITLMAQQSMQPAIHHLTQLEMLRHYQGEPLDVWLKLDTGMHRLGIAMSAVDECMQYLQSHSSIRSVALMSHFANADDVNNPLNNSQLNNLVNVVNSYDVRASMANSAAICSRENSHLDWVRPGIMLYGASPLAERSAAELELQPAMTFVSRLVSIQQLQAGDTIGYGSSWTCAEAMPVGIVAAGYGDGYPRHASDGTPVLVNDQVTRLIGRVSMDSLYVDLRNIEASVGDPVELWGGHIAVDTVAQHAGTIAYELLCNAGNAAKLA